MWTTVESRHKRGRPKGCGKQSTPANRGNVSVSSEQEAKDLLETSKVFLNAGKSLKDDPHTSVLSQFSLHLFHTLREALDPLFDGTVTQVRFIGLGIGPYRRSESIVSFLQLSLFLAMRACIELHHPSLLTLASTFDPAYTPLHEEIGDLLGLSTEGENRYGVYGAPVEGEVRVFFMPNCPWTLFHNLLISLWPSADGDATNRRGDSLQRVVVIGNNLQQPPVSASVHHQGVRLCTQDPRLLCCIHSTPLLSLTASERKKGKTKGLTYQEADGTLKCLSGVSISAFWDAFHGAALSLFNVEMVKHEPTLFRTEPPKFIFS